MFSVNNNLESVENVKRARENAPWTEEEIRYLVQRSVRGFHPEATAFELNRSKNEVILMGLELGLFTVERAEYEQSEQEYLDIFNGSSQLNTAPGAEDHWNDLSVEPRTMDQIEYIANVFNDKIWYNRHLATKYRVEHGLETVDPEVWARALAAEERIRQKYGEENLGPYSDFEWGMLNGKLSAVRWVMGCEWDMLDT